MSDENKPQHDDDYVPEDDAIIGIWFRRSMWGVAALGALTAALYWGLRGGPIDLPTQEINPTKPEQVETEVSPPNVRFTDISQEAGINFVHWNGADSEKLLPETMGSGSAFFDYDNDGDPDLLLVNGASWPHATAKKQATSKLYRNDGQGHFEDVSAEAGLDLEAYGTAVAIGDVNADGWLDVFIAAVGPNHLFLNQQGRFKEVTDSAGVAGEAGEWSSSSAFFDQDNDGDLDLMVCNYVRWSREIDRDLDYRLTGVGRAYGPPDNYGGTFLYFFRNRGDGTFDDVSAESGVQVVNEATGVPVAKALALAVIDVDGDGFLDVLVANDTVRNFFFHNQGDGTFFEAAELYGLAYDRNGNATGAMGADAAYYRNDDDLGFAIGNFANEMTSLYISQGDATLYADEAIGDGLGAPSRTALSFGVLFFDYDLDGRLDVLQSNGHLENEINSVDPRQTYEQPPQLFWNAGPDGQRSFAEVAGATTGDLAIPLVGRGGSLADIDGDGDLDVVLTQAGRRAVLLRNDQDLNHHWLRVKLADPTGQRHAIGAWIEVKSSGVTQRRQVMPSRGYQSQSELPVTFGLGDGAQVDTLRVTWPDGTVQQVETVLIDQLNRIEKGN